MKKHIVVFAVLLQAASVSLLAQSKPKTGDIISGIVADSEGPMMMVNVTERDSADLMVAHSITDIDGSFSFRLVDPDHSIQITYVGYEKVSIPIDTTYFEIKMKERDDLPAVEMTSDPGYQYKGIPIPLREAAKSVDTIDMSEFEYLGIYTIDEALNAKFGLDLP